MATLSPEPVPAPARDAAAQATRQRAWRWHFLAALLVVPFVLWQSITGVLYLWGEAAMQAQHPAFYQASAGAHQPLDKQVAAARAAWPAGPLGNVRVSADPTRSTQVQFQDGSGLPVMVFVDPARAQVLGVLQGFAWLPGWSRSLHGGWPLGNTGSVLLELGACWTLVMIATGLYLWWPRAGRSLRQVLLPRLHAGARVFWRDLHATVAVWFAALIALFLCTAMPWTWLWGSQLLQPVQRLLGQSAPAAAGFAPVWVDPQQVAPCIEYPLQTMLERARADGLQGDLLLRMVEGPAAAAVSLRTLRARAADEHYQLYTRDSATPLATVDWSAFPALARAVATGVDLHEGSYFGALGPWINTGFALVLVWLVLTGMLAWWRRRPARGLGVPTRPTAPWSRTWTWMTVIASLLLPVLGASLLLLWLGERVWRGVAGTR